MEKNLYLGMKNDEQKLQLAREVCLNPLYAHVNGCALSQWSAVPTLSREKLVAIPLAQRLFVTWSQVEILRPTSGTSGKGILIIPRNSSSVLKHHKISQKTAFYSVLTTSAELNRREPGRGALSRIWPSS